MKELANAGDQHQHADQTVDNRRNAREHAHRGGKQRFDARRGKLCQIHRGKKADWHAEDDCTCRAVDAGQDERQNAVLRICFRG